MTSNAAIDTFCDLASRLRMVREAQKDFLRRATAASILISPRDRVIGLDRPADAARSSANPATNFKRIPICDD